LEVTVASRDSQSLYRAPANVTVFTRDDILNYGFTSVQQLLNFVPGFSATRDIEQGTADRISVRGRSTALSESVLFLLDGQRLNDLYTGGISLLNRQLALLNIEQIEVIRGPGSALYGSNAFLGVVNMISRKSGHEVSATLGTFGHNSISWFNSGLFENADEWSIYLSRFEEDGDQYLITDGFGIERSTQDPIEGIDFYSSVSLDYFNFTARYTERQLKDFLTFGNHGENNENMQQWSVAANYQQRMSDDWKFNYRLSLSRDKWNTRATLIPQGIELEPGVALDEDFYGGPLLETEAASFLMDHSLFLNDKQTLLLGLNIRESRVRDVANVTTHNPITLEYFGGLQANRDALNFSDRASRSVVSVYFQHQWDLAQQWQLTSGLRLDDYSDFGSSSNPRLALVWQPDQHSSLKFLYASAFRAPNFLELYDKNNPVDFGNRQLDAETVNTSEISWLSQQGDWRYELNVFYNEFKDLIVLGPPVSDPDNPLLAPTFINGGEARTSGIEGAVGYQSYLGSVQFSWSHLFDSLNADIADTQWSLTYLKKWQNYSWSFNGYTVSDVDSQNRSDRRIVLGSKLKYQYNDSASYYLLVKNLLDNSYQTPSSVLPMGVANRGRQWILGGQWRW
jgi:outer membrane cobalamin receptor